MNTQNNHAPVASQSLSAIRWTAICYLPSNDDFVSASHVVGTNYNSETEAKQAAIAYFNTHACIAFLVYQQAVNTEVSHA
jgi:hypothetical protein